MGKSKKDTLVVIGSRVSPVQPGKTGKRGPEENSVSKPSKKAKLIEKDSRKNPDDVHKTHVKKPSIAVAKKQESSSDSSSDSEDEPVKAQAKGASKPVALVTGPKYGKRASVPQESSSEDESSSEEEPPKTYVKAQPIHKPKAKEDSTSKDDSSSEDVSDQFLPIRICGGYLDPANDDPAIYDLPLNPLHSHDVPGTLDPSPEPPLGASLPRIASSNIPPGCSYAINPDGSIKAGECGKRVLHRMRELCQQIFRHEMFGFDWRKIDKSKKECVIAHLHEEFPVSSLACRFSDQWMIDKMGRYIKHRRAEARKAYGKGKRRPTWVAKEDWKKLKEEFEKQPEKWKQQKNAARARLEANIISHLGSGGWTSFEEDFFEYTGRAPTDLEREYAIKHGIKQLLARLNACDGQEALNKP